MTLFLDASADMHADMPTLLMPGISVIETQTVCIMCSKADCQGAGQCALWQAGWRLLKAKLLSCNISGYT